MKTIVNISNALFSSSRSKIMQRLLKGSSLLIAATLFFLLILTGCAKVEQGKVVGFGQSMSGMVQSFVKVELSDGSEVSAWLPMDDNLWDQMSAAAKNSQRSDLFVEIKYKKSDDYWEYVKVVEKE